MADELELGLSSDYIRDFSTAIEVRVIGEGTYGSVALSKYPENDDLFALKTFYRHPNINREVVERLFHEIEALIHCPHPCLVPIIGYSLPTSTMPLQIAMVYATHQSLRDVLDRVKSGHQPAFMDETGIAIIIMGIIMGMKFLHSQGKVHGDLKPENILINDQGHVLLGDINSRHLAEEEFIVKAQKGPERYMAPELYTHNQAGSSADVFSFALILYEVVMEEPLFLPNINLPDHTRRVVCRDRPQITANVPKSVKTIIEKCWSPVPKERYSFEQIFQKLNKNGYKIYNGVDTNRVTDYIQSIGEQKHEPQLPLAVFGGVLGRPPLGRGTSRNPFYGIIGELSTQCGRKYEHFLKVTASSKEDTACNVVHFAEDTIYKSSNREGQWICYDFQPLRVTMTGYGLKSAPEDDNNIKSWKIEGSNDGEKWILFDQRENEDGMNGPNAVGVYGVVVTETVRYIRLFQTDKNSEGSWALVLQAFEIYGKAEIDRSDEKAESLMAFFATLSGGNLDNQTLFTVNASSFQEDFPPKNVANADMSLFRSEDLPDQWISYDFTTMLIQPHIYVIQTDQEGSHPREWVVEVSRDGNSWNQLGDKVMNNSDGVVDSWFRVDDETGIRSFRLRQTGQTYQGDNVFAIRTFVLHGKMIFEIKPGQDLKVPELTKLPQFFPKFTLDEVGDLIMKWHKGYTTLQFIDLLKKIFPHVTAIELVDPVLKHYHDIPLDESLEFIFQRFPKLTANKLIELLAKVPKDNFDSKKIDAVIRKHFPKIGSALLTGKVFRPDDNLKGIIAHLMAECEGVNVMESNRVKVTSSKLGNPYIHPQIVADLKKNAVFWTVCHTSQDKIADNSRRTWIMYEFLEHQILPTHYTIVPYSGKYNMKSWAVEISKTGKKWTRIHSKENSTDLIRGPPQTYEVEKTKIECRFIRLVNIGKNWGGNDALAIAAWEIFGTLRLAMATLYV